MLTVTLTNPSDTHALVVGKYHSPLDVADNGALFTSQAFVVRDAQGAPLRYQGIMVKRRPPGEDRDFVLLPPRGSVSVRVNLRSAYPLPAGDYTVTPDRAADAWHTTVGAHLSAAGAQPVGLAAVARGASTRVAFESAPFRLHVK